jgi:hypothetical protein
LVPFFLTPGRHHRFPADAIMKLVEDGFGTPVSSPDASVEAAAAEATAEVTEAAPVSPEAAPEVPTALFVDPTPAAAE